MLGVVATPRIARQSTLHCVVTSRAPFETGPPVGPGRKGAVSATLAIYHYTLAASALRRGLGAALETQLVYQNSHAGSRERPTRASCFCVSVPLPPLTIPFMLIAHSDASEISTRFADLATKAKWLTMP